MGLYLAGAAQPGQGTEDIPTAASRMAPRATSVPGTGGQVSVQENLMSGELQTSQIL